MRERLNRVCEAVAVPAPFASHPLKGCGCLVVLHEYRPAQSCASDTWPALLWFHGGGYVMGKALHDDVLCQRFADDLGIRVFSLDYPLAPEHPYPHALLAAEAAWDWLLSEALPSCRTPRIAVGGASAGGGLAASLVLRLRDRSRTTGVQAILPCLQWLMYPMLDSRTRVAQDASDTLLWTGACNRQAWHSLLDTRAAALASLPADMALAMAAQPYFSPSEVDDLSGLPEAFIAIGTIDLFYAENQAYAKRLHQSGVPCELHEFADAPHAFDAFAPQASASVTFEGLRMTCLRNALFQGS
ncbi:alpha/beta hydrolase fold domain-containing protein [Limnohabitans sp. T6-5]|uniref:alpha/beta hydrolase fold domain-containing protein n=1 Tax=Limnohabitans sp. T6-5 TaxID=1100724 RepID=UPI002102550A|nr:alpha/beta hydrolase fold domain-containing protein [Limnohabitans sp. T6-5]